MARYEIYDQATLDEWYSPHPVDIAPDHLSKFRVAKEALTALLLGRSTITAISRRYGICHKRLKRMAMKAPTIAHDGMPHGFRVCIPWGSYSTELSFEPAELPLVPGRFAWHKVSEAVPSVKALIDGFATHLPPGRPPSAFVKLHQRVLAELKQHNLEDKFPLNDPGKGKRSLLALLKRRQSAVADVDLYEPQSASNAPVALEQAVRMGLFARTEFDAHQIDVECKISIDMPNGARVTRKVSRLWLLIEIETESRAVRGWLLCVGQSYDNLDVALCLSKSMEPWAPRDLTIPDLFYAPGAGMPVYQAATPIVTRSAAVALDNFLAHSAHALEAAFCRARGGVMIFGKSHTPRSRPIVEQFFSRLERGALRKIPGGFEPAKRLGENKIRISNFSPDAHPIQMHLLEELLDVIIANYNATPHSALGQMTPLAYLTNRKESAFAFAPETCGLDAADMASTIVSLPVKGNKDNGELPHVTYLYADYRSPSLNDKWGLIGTRILARVNRRDLRSIVLLQSATVPFGVATARAPWSRAPHDERTRRIICRWSKQRSDFSIAGVECAIEAFIAHLRSTADTSQPAVDQLARLQQLHFGRLPDIRSQPAHIPVRVPRGGKVNLDD